MPNLDYRCASCDWVGSGMDLLLRDYLDNLDNYEGFSIACCPVCESEDVFENNEEEWEEARKENELFNKIRKDQLDRWDEYE